MTCDELIQEICEALNLTSDEAKSRVARRLNARYRRLTSSIGLESSRRSTVSKAVTIGNQTVTYTGIEKVITVYTTSGTTHNILEEISPDEMLTVTLVESVPSKFCLSRVYPTSADIKINCIPATAFTLYADVDVSLTNMTGSMMPQFPESFHDILVYGVMADEYRKMEKVQLAMASDQDYERRLSDLRMFIAVSASKDVYQGKSVSTRWWQQGNPN